MITDQLRRQSVATDHFAPAKFLALGARRMLVLMPLLTIPTLLRAQGVSGFGYLSRSGIQVGSACGLPLGNSPTPTMQSVSCAASLSGYYYPNDDFTTGLYDIEASFYMSAGSDGSFLHAAADERGSSYEETPGSAPPDIVASSYAKAELATTLHVTPREVTALTPASVILNTFVHGGFLEEPPSGVGVSESDIFLQLPAGGANAAMNVSSQLSSSGAKVVSGQGAQPSVRIPWTGGDIAAYMSLFVSAETSFQPWWQTVHSTAFAGTIYASSITTASEPGELLLVRTGLLGLLPLARSRRHA